MALHLAQVNIARMKAPLEDPVMAPFPADEAFIRTIDWSSFDPCPAA